MYVEAKKQVFNFLLKMEKENKDTALPLDKKINCNRFITDGCLNFLMGLV